MDKIIFLAGNETKALEFLKNISSKDKVAIVSHVDLDGVASAKVISKVFRYDLLKFVAYEQINDDLVKELKKSNITKVIMTDLSIDNIKIIKQIEKFADILVIDHHLFDEDFNSNKTTFINCQEYCAAYLCYLLFFKTKNIKELDWLVACACISDWKYFNNKDFMLKVMKKYEDKFEIVSDKTDFGGIRKSGRFWDLQLKLNLALIYFGYELVKAFNLLSDDIENLNNLTKYADEVQDEIDKSVKRFEKEKEVFGEVYFWVFSGRFQIKSIVATLASVKYSDKTIIVLKKNQNNYSFSARRQDRKVNVVEVLKNAIFGLSNAFAGGHVAAGGGYILSKDLEKFKENLKKLVI
jgi:single-stranded DNA-specific DHH superfamily exonuclease